MTLIDARESELSIAVTAAEMRGEAKELTPALFVALWPLLYQPIPEDYLVTSPPVKGKPYESTGIRSVQVQIDRMNNVLSPLWWWDEAAYEEAGKLCQVTVYVGNPTCPQGDAKRVLMARSSRGGVDRGSTLGNVYKGSYTNAAKLAFARIGPGREVYLGALDPDPEVGGADADESSPAVSVNTIGDELAASLWKRADMVGLTDRLRLAASHVAGRDVGSCETRESAVNALSGLEFGNAAKLDDWLSRKADEADEQKPEQEEEK